MKLKDIVNQLELCNFTDELGHPLENNVAFIELKKLSEKEKYKVDYKPEEDYALIAFTRKIKNIWF